MRSYPLAAFANIVITCAGILVASNSTAREPAAEPVSRVVLASDVRWEQLNPARGDKSPMAGTLWGDRNGTVPTGFLVKFADGFSSPPHIHNTSYRGVVISGHIHNDDPGAADMWLPTGSYWTQPKGEVHITAARGSTNVAYIEIDEGPYHVLPVEEAFGSGEKPINVDISNMVWLDLPGMPATANGPKVAYLWGKTEDNQLNGSLIRLPAAYAGKIHSHGSLFRAVVIQGQPQYQVPHETSTKTLLPGSYFSSKGKSVHHVASETGEETLIYVRTNGKYDIIPAQQER